MTDYFTPQLTGSPCAGKNCAAASCAMSIAFGTANRDRLTADDVRRESNVSCIPGQATPSGGLFISDVVRVCAAHGVTIDYGSDQSTYYERWTPAVAKARLKTGYGAIFLGDYDQVPTPIREPGSTFQGDHSTWVHDYLTHLPPHGSVKAAPTVCWHDPLRTKPIRAPWTVAVAYWQKPTSPIRGFAGFVRGIPTAPDSGTGPPVAYGSDVPAAIRALDPTGRSAAVWITRTGHAYGSVIGLADFAAALDRAGIDWGGVMNVGDVLRLRDWRP